MGHQVAHLRRKLLADRRKAVGLSQGDLATKLDIERSTVVRWEAGRTAPQPWIRPRLADALQVSEEQLEDLLRPEVEGDDADVDRRAFAGLATALALAPLTRARVGSLIGTSHVRQLQARTARLRRLDDHLGGMDTYTVYTSDIAATERLIKTASYSGETARALTGVLAEQAQMAGWAAFDAGRFADSRRHYAVRWTPHESLVIRDWKATRSPSSPMRRRTARQPPINTDCWHSYDAPRSGAAARAACVGARRGRPPSESQRALDTAVAAVNETSTAPEPDFVFCVDPLETDEPERAAAVTEHALDLAAGVGSVRPGNRLRGVLQQLSRHGGPEVAAVLERARG
jgi:transcriptional regulator with XRE-family HTH domain